MEMQSFDSRPAPSVAFLLRVADHAMLRRDYDQVETLIELVYRHFDRKEPVEH